MGALSKMLPNPAFKYLQKVINPPKPRQDKILQYSDTLVILKLHQDSAELALKLLEDVVSSVYDTCPGILRCEMHAYISKHAKFKVHITLRFSNNFNATNLQVDGLSFKDWLEHTEAKGLWTCVLRLWLWNAVDPEAFIAKLLFDLTRKPDYMPPRYHEAIRLVAGFDRGRSGRTILSLNEPTVDNGQGLEDMDKTTSESETLVEHVGETVQMREISEVRRGKQRQ
ncbi:MAG: hypothetical protein Q9213_001297 [Squamulea squamosa]